MYYTKKEPKKAQPFANKELSQILILNYSIIVATRPEPTVLPPSRIAKVKP
jgi:hypothetical protein